MGYEALVQTAGLTVEESCYSGDYQGDLYMIVRDGEGRYGYLVTGYGSCSGCDAYEGSRDDDLYGLPHEDRYDLTLAQIIEALPTGELVRLRDALVEGVQWVENPADLAVVLAEALAEDAKGTRWYYTEPEFRKWALSMLEKYTAKQED